MEIRETGESEVKVETEPVVEKITKPKKVDKARKAAPVDIESRYQAFLKKTRGGK